MIRTLVIAATTMLASCASVEAPPRYSAMPSAGEELTPQEVSSGFVVAVVDSCAAAGEAGKTLEELGGEKIVRETSPDAIRAPKPGAILWAPVVGKGIVTIEESGGECDVAAYGPPIEVTFNAIASALLARGYVSGPVAMAGFRSLHNELAKTIDGRTVRVTLMGNEPGAPGMRPRFSTASAFVRTTTP